MTISDEITKLNTNLTDSYTAVNNKGGTLPASENFDNLPNAINSITELKGETKTVTPTTSQQTITPSSGKNGITQVTVNAVTSAIDSDIQAGNIKSGVSILGVNGTVTELKGETRSVSITSASGNTFTPSSGKNGITSITVTPTNQNRTVTPTTSQQTLSVNSGYSGNGTITVNAVTSSIDSDIVAGNIRSGVNILGVNGTVTELAGETKSVSITSTSGNTFTPSSGKNGITSITVTPTNEARTVTPTTSQQSLTVNSGYSGNGTITVNAVTSSIDSNITANNIKKDVTILGVTGTYEGASSYNVLNNCLVRNNGSIELLSKDNYTLGQTDTNISSSYALSEAYKNDSTIKYVNLSKLTKINGAGSLQYAFQDSTVSSIDFSNLTSLGANYAISSAFQNTELKVVDFPSLTTISHSGTMESAFNGCSSLVSASFPLLTTIGGTIRASETMKFAFSDTNLLSIDFPNLQIIGSNTSDKGISHFRQCFRRCPIEVLMFPNLEKIYNTGTASGANGTFCQNETIKKMYFPKLDTITYGNGASSSNQGACLYVFSGCSALTELHFGAANQAAIEASLGYSTAWGRGAGNVTIYFDL